MEQKESVASNFTLVVGTSLVGTLVSSGIVFLLILYFQDFFKGFSKKVAKDVEISSKQSWDYDDS